MGLAGTAKELEASDLPPPRGEPRAPAAGCPVSPGSGWGSPLGVWGWGELFQGWAPRQQWGWKSPGGQKLGHKHVVSGVWRAVCPSES